MTDPTGLLVVTIREHLASLGPPWSTSVVVRGGRPNEGDRPRMVVVQRVAVRRSRFVLGRYRYVVRSYGVGSKPEIAERDASVLSGLVSDALHRRWPRRSGGGVATYEITEDVGGQPGTDPDTGWPYESSTYRVPAPTQVVTA